MTALRAIARAIARAFREPDGPVQWTRVHVPGLETSLYIPVRVEREEAP